MKTIKRIGVLIGILALFFIGFIILFVSFSPQFGGKITEAQKKTFAKTGHYENDVFINQEPIIMDLNCHSITSMIKDMMNPNPDITPKQNVDVRKISPERLFDKKDATTRIYWLGHSSFIIQIDGMTALIDPIFSQYASPHPWLGRKRFNNAMPISLEEIENVDMILISHDHYDHLDYPTIKALSHKTDHFFVPLGVGNHLNRWGIDSSRVTEMDWWDEFGYEDLKIVFTPSRHMSGRGLTDQSSTLWGSWIIQSDKHNVFFSGDGGYGKHFKEIGNLYGPFDIGLMECGQYNENWKNVHMLPEETVQASLDVKAEWVIPIHWGAFTLAPHSWKEPISRFEKEAQINNLNFATPRIGETIVLDSNIFPKSKWWEWF